MDYETLRQIADSWGLIYLFVLFVGIILFTFRPGSKQIAEKIAEIPFKEEMKHGEE